MVLRASAWHDSCGSRPSTGRPHLGGSGTTDPWSGVSHLPASSRRHLGQLIPGTPGCRAWLALGRRDGRSTRRPDPRGRQLFQRQWFSGSQRGSAQWRADAVQGRTPAAPFSLLLTGVPGATYEIQASTNLNTWEPLMTVTNMHGRVQCCDTGYTNFSSRFYRAALIE